MIIMHMVRLRDGHELWQTELGHDYSVEVRPSQSLIRAGHVVITIYDECDEIVASQVVPEEDVLDSVVRLTRPHVCCFETCYAYQKGPVT